MYRIKLIIELGSRYDAQSYNIIWINILISILDIYIGHTIRGDLHVIYESRIEDVALTLSFWLLWGFLKSL